MSKVDYKVAIHSTEAISSIRVTAAAGGDFKIGAGCTLDDVRDILCRFTMMKSGHYCIH
jgi:hypothetical protein